MLSRTLKFWSLRYIITISIVFGFDPLVHGAEYSLFTSNTNTTLQTTIDTTELPRNLPKAKQWRPVSINPVFSNQNSIAEKDILELGLFPGLSYRAYIDIVSTDINKTKTIRGRIDGFPMGHALISINGNSCIGSIYIPEKNEYFLIRYDSNSRTHYLLDMNSSQLDILDDLSPLLPPRTISLQSTQTNTQTATFENDPLDQVTIDVMILYTPAAKDWANNSSSGIENVIAQTISMGQQALDNSNTYLNLNLVYSGEINYTESGDAATDLERLTYTSDGYMNEVQALRDEYKADVVTLFTKIDDTGGIAWILENPSGNERFAYSVVRVQQVASGYTYIHEMGHNMGCGHHKEQTTQPGPGMFSYSAGWRWTGDDNGKYCSIMSYSSGIYYTDGIDHTYVAHFSNPVVSYKGISTGDSSNGDNARTIREIKSVIANYRIGSTTGVSTFIDIGLRLYDGSEIVKIACEQGAPTSPLRISKFGTTYGIALVDIDDPYATGIIIQTSSGPKELRKLQ